MRQKRSRRRSKSKHNRKNSDSGPQFFPQPFGDISQCNWFWENYYAAFEWKERHQVAYWKSRSIALEYENNVLYQYLQSITFNNPDQVWQAASKCVSNSRNCSAARTNTIDNPISSSSSGQEEVEEEEVEEEDEEDEYEVSEEMMAFFEKSIRHKLERQKQREKERKEREPEPELTSVSDPDDPTLPPKSQIGLKRTKEIKLMYGKAAPMILGMETAMQLSFDRNCDLKQPKLWPNLPLNM